MGITWDLQETAITFYKTPDANFSILAQIMFVLWE